MSAASTKSTATTKPTMVPKARSTTGLRTQRVDEVASLLMSILVVIGLIVLLLFVVWLTQTFTSQAETFAVDREEIAGRGDHAEGFERDIEPPGAEEIEELSEPTLEASLEAITDVATSVAASLNAVDTDATATTRGSEMGDSRRAGPLGEGDDIVPRFERWELKYQAKGLRPYAAQLDFHQIELACIGGGVQTVDYASNLATAPQSRSGTSEAENQRRRLYFMWRQEGPLKEFDRQLLNQAGVRTEGRHLLKFIPKELEGRLFDTEMDYARANGHSSVKEIAKTIFESRSSAAGGYEFVVIQQRYRIPSK